MERSRRRTAVRTSCVRGTITDIVLVERSCDIAGNFPQSFRNFKCSAPDMGTKHLVLIVGYV